MELLILTTCDNSGYSVSYQFVAKKISDFTIKMAEWHVKNNAFLETDEMHYLPRGNKTIIKHGISEDILDSPEIIDIDSFSKGFKEFLQEELSEKKKELVRLKCLSEDEGND